MREQAPGYGVGQFTEHWHCLSLRRTYATVARYVCARACENPLLLSITVTTQISSCVYLVPPFSFVAYYAPVNGVHVRVRDSNRHPDHRRHFASVRTVNGENERRTDTRREKRTVSRQWKPRAAVHVDEARFGSSRVFFLHRPVVSLSRLTRTREREKDRRILMAAMK